MALRSKHTGKLIGIYKIVCISSIMIGMGSRRGSEILWDSSCDLQRWTLSLFERLINWSPNILIFFKGLQVPLLTVSDSFGSPKYLFLALTTVNVTWFVLWPLDAWYFKRWLQEIQSVWVGADWLVLKWVISQNCVDILMIRMWILFIFQHFDCLGCGMMLYWCH